MHLCSFAILYFGVFLQQTSILVVIHSIYYQPTVTIEYSKHWFDNYYHTSSICNIACGQIVIVGVHFVWLAIKGLEP